MCDYIHRENKHNLLSRRIVVLVLVVPFSACSLIEPKMKNTHLAIGNYARSELEQFTTGKPDQIHYLSSGH